MWEVQAKSTEFRKRLWANRIPGEEMDYVDWKAIRHHSTMMLARVHENVEDAIKEFIEKTENRWHDLYDYRLYNIETGEIIPCAIFL